MDKRGRVYCIRVYSQTIANKIRTCGISLALLTRIILASTDKNAWVLDPIAGSSTTGIAANLVGRRYLGIEREKEFVEISQKRREEIEDLKVYSQFRRKIKDIAKSETLMPCLFACEEEPIMDLPF